MLVDSHCHLDFADFDGERDAILARAKDAGVGLMVTICTRVRRFESIARLTEEYDRIFCSVGTHPHNAGEEADIAVDTLIDLAQGAKVVAIGEAGLDYHYDNAPHDVQKTVFTNHIEAARQTGLPLIIHARSADADMMDILRQETGKGSFPFIMHCFSSGRDLALTAIELGGYVSFSGILTFKKSQELRAIAAEVPLGRLLVETDAPYLAPVPYRGKRNEPAFVKETAACLAELRGLSLDELAGQTTDNVHAVFGKLPPRAQEPGLA